MISARFFLTDEGTPAGFEVEGHAGWAESGKDIVCASVSSAVELVCNTITDFYGIDADVRVDDRGKISLLLPEIHEPDEHSAKLILSLVSHLEAISDEFPKTIRIENHPRKRRVKK